LTNPRKPVRLGRWLGLAQGTLKGSTTTGCSPKWAPQNGHKVFDIVYGIV